ncbi:MAG: GNAT family N-acetyltransferase [Candidatus Acidiferrales bacterium]
MQNLAAEIEVRHCDLLSEYDECVRLERLTWGEDITVPAAIFVVAHHSGGQVLGAFAGGRMVGFTLALAGLRGKQRFLHSHMTAVLPEFQNRGVGRRLKLFQRQDALRRDIPLVEWTFDPLELKNARFNLTRLGAVVRRYLPDCYGVTNSPLHAGLPTDRLVAEWWLDSERVKGILADDVPPANAAAERISLPCNLPEIKMRDRAAGLRIQSGARMEFQRWLAEGYVATGVENRGDSTDYVLEPRASIAGLRLEEFHEE